LINYESLIEFGWLPLTDFGSGDEADGVPRTSSAAEKGIKIPSEPTKSKTKECSKDIVKTKDDKIEKAGA